MSNPEVSVCLPAYQAEPYVAAAIESVLDQSHQDWELVIVDNASNDRTVEIARSYGDARIVVHTNPVRVALAANWNLAVGRARGRYVKVLPADDLLRPRCLETQAKTLAADPALALVSCRRDFIDRHGKVVLRGRGLVELTGDQPASSVVARVMRSGINPIGEPAAMMFRRRDFFRAGNFDASLPFPMDLELAVRLLRYGGFHGQEDALATFRIRADSYTAATFRLQGAEHRALLQRIADDDNWSVSHSHLRIGLARTRVATLKRRLLFAAVSRR